jgi:tetratricopeptide (TPR) repeat protein
LAAIYILQGRFKEAIDQFKQAIELANNIGEMQWKSTDLLRLAEIYLETGNPENALEELEKALEIAEKEDLQNDLRKVLLRKTRAYLEMNSLDDAQNVSDELEESIRKGPNQKLMRYFYLAKGEIELEKKNFASAVEEFEKAIPLMPFQFDPVYGNDNAEFHDSLALAQYMAGGFENARSEYEKITELTTGRILVGDIYAKAFYMLGNIYEEQGDSAKAKEHYEKFLDLWKDADSGIAEVDDAKKRLDGL